MATLAGLLANAGSLAIAQYATAFAVWLKML